MQRLFFLIVFSLLLTACARQVVPSSHTLEIKPASFEEMPGTEPFHLPDSDQTVYVYPTLLITLHDIEWARQSKDHRGHPSIEIKLTDHAGERLAQYTRHHIGQPMALLLDGQLLNAPVIRSVIRNMLAITGGSSGLAQNQVDTIIDSVSQLNSGK